MLVEAEADVLASYSDLLVEAEVDVEASYSDLLVEAEADVLASYSDLLVEAEADVLASYSDLLWLFAILVDFAALSINEWLKLLDAISEVTVDKLVDLETLSDLIVLDLLIDSLKLSLAF